MRKILVVVDMQNDFIDGALGTKEAVAILPAVIKKIRSLDGEARCRAKRACGEAGKGYRF